MAEPGHILCTELLAGARGCLGARFRHQGRGPAAYDCVGVAIAAARHAGIRLHVPAEYDHRGTTAGQVEQLLAPAGFRPTQPAAGDLLWLGGGRPHFGIWTGAGVIEADAGLRRVVERPGWPAAASAWRFPPAD